MAWANIDHAETPDELRARCEAADLPSNFVELLERCADDYGTTTVWRFFEHDGRWATLNYQELRDAVFRLSSALTDFGIAPGDHVILMANNRPEFPLIWLALGCIGAVMIPANIRYTSREIDYVFTDGDASFAIVDAEFVGIFANGERASAIATPDKLLTIDAVDGFRSLGEIFDAATTTRPPTEALGRDTLVNIQYTSGTTGFPKGCMLSHDYWILMGFLGSRQLGVPISNVLVAQNFYYMDAQWLLVLTMQQGGTYFVAGRPSARKFMGWVHEFDIHFCLMFEPIFKQPPSPLDAPNPLRVINIFGLTPANHKILESRFDVRAREAFGMTEIANALYMPIQEEGMVGSGSCGIPTPFREAKVMASIEREAEPNEIGELWVRGRSIMQGYYKKPEANAELFQPGGWFRTGDRFLRDAAGYFYYKGRSKDMIRRNSENVAAREVETVLRELSQVEEAAVVAVPDELRGEEIKAYIKLRPGDASSDDITSIVLDHCAAHLAKFKIPRYVGYVESFPMTASGRVEKKTLINGVEDLRVNSYDAQDRVWR